MNGTNVVPYEVLPPASNASESSGDSPLHRLRQQIRPYPAASGGDPRSRALLYGAAGSGAALVSAGIASALPDGADVRASSFYLLGQDAAASLVDLVGSFVAPLMIIGLLLLITTGLVYVGKTEHPWVDALCVAQPVLGVTALGGSAVGWITLAALLALNLLLWVAIIVAVGALAIGVLAALAQLE